MRSVLKKGQLEAREAKCPNFGTCGGCNYQEIPYEQQLALKKEQVLRLIDAVYEGDGYQYDGILSVRKDGQYREWGYRNKMEFSFGDAVKDGPLTLGLHKKGSFHDIVDAEGCQIVHPDYSAVLACVREYVKENNIPYHSSPPRSRKLIIASLSAACLPSLLRDRSQVFCRSVTTVWAMSYKATRQRSYMAKIGLKRKS